MKNSIYTARLNTIVQTILMMAMFLFSLGLGKVNTVYAQETTSNTDNCVQLLAQAEAKFHAVLPKDGSVPAGPEAEAAAAEYIRVAKLCYDEIAAPGASADLQSETPVFIDDGGVLLGQPSSAEFVIKQGNKWGSATQGTAGGTVTYSFMGNGISLADESAGTNIALTSLPRFQP